MTGQSWYNTGFQGMAQEQARLDSSYGPPRFWVKPGETKDLVFVDDEPVCIHEHNPKIDGKFQNAFTCVQGIHEDVVCCQKLGLQSRYYIGYLTIVDCSEWSDAKGNKHQFELKLIGAKLRTLKKFRRKKDDKGSLIGCMYRAAREDDKSSSCGDEFEFQRKVDMDKLFAAAAYKGKKLVDMWDAAESDGEKMVALQRTFQVKPDANGKLPRVVPLFNYLEVLKPKSPAELRILLGAAEVGGGDDRARGAASGATRGSGVTSDDVPF